MAVPVACFAVNVAAVFVGAARVGQQQRFCHVGKVIRFWRLPYAHWAHGHITDGDCLVACSARIETYFVHA